MASEYLKYVNNGRDGYVGYVNGNIELKFYYELEGGKYIALIYIPTVDNWYSKTGIAIDQRQAITEFIARQLIKDQAPNSTYEICEDCISLLN
jgi:hypothetical protein